MQGLFHIIVLLLPVLLEAQVFPVPNRSNVEERVITDLNDDGKNDTIRLYGTVDDGIEKGPFTKLTLSIDGRRTTYTARDSWGSFGSYFTTGTPNAVSSPYVFVLKEEGQSYIFLFGHEYPGGPDEFSILKVSGRKQEMIFDSKLGYPKDLVDLNGDGRCELIAQEVATILSATNDGLIGTYSPFIVYTLSPIFAIDMKLTEQYNKDHYIWKGTKYDGEIHVLYPNDKSKPTLIKTD